MNLFFKVLSSIYKQLLILTLTKIAVMKKTLITLLSLFFLTTQISSQMNNPAYLEKTKTLESTIETLYDVISGEAGEKRDWDLFRFLFTTDAKLIPIQKSAEGAIRSTYMSPEGYIRRSGQWLEENGFFEKEISRKVDTYGSMTHVFSTYESYRSEADAEPFSRGINSIQLINDGTRWWIINIYWQAESEDNPIPEKYLSKL